MILAFASTGGMSVPEWLWLGKSWSSGKWDSLYSVLPSTSRGRGHPIPKAHAQMSYIAVIPHTRMLFFLMGLSSSPAPVAKFWLLFTVALWAMAESRKDLEGRACQEEETERVRKETSWCSFPSSPWSGP